MAGPQRQCGVQVGMLVLAGVVASLTSLACIRVAGAEGRGLSGSHALWAATLSVLVGVLTVQCVLVTRAGRRRLEALRSTQAALERSQRALREAEGAIATATQAREALTGQLLEASRFAGMAEVASGVLHNVGNVLNSVNVSAGMVAARLEESELESLERACSLLDEHKADAARFLAEDDRGRMIAPFLSQVAACLREENLAMQRELLSVKQGIEHVKQVVSAQQSHAKRSACMEVVSPSELMETALRMQVGELDRLGIRVKRQLDASDAVALDKHQILQILVNLVTNAVHAMQSVPGDARGLVCQTKSYEQGGRRMIEFSVKDSGEGILPENMERIFSHGFTTRRDGHGFGLHSAANSARSMGGTLSVQSDGPGLGATFTLRVPVGARQSDRMVDRRRVARAAKAEAA